MATIKAACASLLLLAYSSFLLVVSSGGADEAAKYALLQIQGMHYFSFRRVVVPSGGSDKAAKYAHTWTCLLFQRVKWLKYF